MKRLAHYLFVHHRRNWIQLIRFGLVGGSGVLVNLLTIVVAHRFGPDDQLVFWDLPFTDFNVRWYHVYSTLGFLIANLWNFQLNRTWTFKSGKHAGWLAEYWPFLVVGAVGQAIGLGLETLLMHPGSFLALPSSVFDNSSGLRTKFYWAHLIQIAVVTPLTFLLNKLWTFRAVRGIEARADGAGMPAVATDVAVPAEVTELAAATLVRGGEGVPVSPSSPRRAPVDDDIAS